MIRLATLQDCSQILQIYNQYIDTVITFENSLPTEEVFTKRMAGFMENYPYLVCEENGLIVGYAYAHRHMERDAYQWNAELSVYLDRSHTSKGLGKRLYGALIEILKLQEIRTVYGCVTLPNEKSEKLHLSLGFTCLGVYHNAGYKCNKWHDVAWFEKAIAPYDKEPRPFLSIKNLSIIRNGNIVPPISTFLPDHFSGLPVE